jgi:hypothetical protein
MFFSLVGGKTARRTWYKKNKKKHENDWARSLSKEELAYPILLARTMFFQDIANRQKRRGYRLKPRRIVVAKLARNLSM